MNDVAKTPTHLWAVGGLSALWNAFGVFDYLMTQMHNDAYLSGFTDQQRAYFDSFPPAMEAAWAFGVWGGLFGSLLLLARSRHAVAAFGVSLIGLAGSTLYQYVLAAPPAENFSPATIGMNLLIWAVAIALLVYAIRQQKNGVLR